jgi:hypothetical protein
MPELRLREVRLPELHLPEMSRDDITRAIGDATRDVELPSVDLSKIDVPKAVASASQAVGLSRSTRVPRLPFIIGGLVTLGLIGFALLNSPAVKPRLQELARKAKEQIEERRAGRMAVDASTDEASTMVDPSGFDAPIADVLSSEPNGSVAIPIESDAYRSSSASAVETPETSRI